MQKLGLETYHQEASHAWQDLLRTRAAVAPYACGAPSIRVRQFLATRAEQTRGAFPSVFRQKKGILNAVWTVRISLFP